MLNPWQKHQLPLSSYQVIHLRVFCQYSSISASVFQLLYRGAGMRSYFTFPKSVGYRGSIHVIYLFILGKADDHNDRLTKMTKTITMTKFTYHSRRRRDRSQLKTLLTVCSSFHLLVRAVCNVVHVNTVGGVGATADLGLRRFSPASQPMVDGFIIICMHVIMIQWTIILAHRIKYKLQCCKYTCTYC